jgi:signal transduction histidine kinase
MTPVVGYVKLLADEELGPLTAPQRKALRSMHDCVSRLRAVIDDLLDVTGLETGSLRFVAVELDVASVATRAAAHAAARCSDRSVRLVTDIPHKRLPAWGDADRLARALVHVLDNAVKFTPHGGSVGIRVQRVPSGYEICVADTGPGIERSLLDRVMEPFYQADASPTRKHGGVGVGLAIARRVAQGHGGELRLASPANERIGDTQFRGTAAVLRIAERAPSGPPAS